MPKELVSMDVSDIDRSGLRNGRSTGAEKKRSSRDVSDIDMDAVRPREAELRAAMNSHALARIGPAVDADGAALWDGATTAAIAPGRCRADSPYVWQRRGADAEAPCHSPSPRPSPWALLGRASFPPPLPPESLARPATAAAAASAGLRRVAGRVASAGAGAADGRADAPRLHGRRRARRRVRLGR